MLLTLYKCTSGNTHEKKMQLIALCIIAELGTSMCIAFNTSNLGQFDTTNICVYLFYNYLYIYIYIIHPSLQGQSLSRIWRSVIQAPFLAGKNMHTSIYIYFYLIFSVMLHVMFCYLNAFKCLCLIIHSLSSSQPSTT